MLPATPNTELCFLFQSTNTSTVTSNFVFSPIGFVNQEYYPFQTVVISSTC